MEYKMKKDDLNYYEHKLIRYLKSLGEPLLNYRDNYKFIERERFIDEIPLEGFIFRKSEYKAI